MDHHAVFSGLQTAAHRVSSDTVVAMRSDSLTRSSAASRITVSPSAKQAATASTGNSSIMIGMMSAAQIYPIEAARRSHHVGHGLTTLDALVFEAQRVASSHHLQGVNNAGRLGFSPTPVMVTRALGWIRPATIQNAPMRCLPAPQRPPHPIARDGG